MFFGSVMGSDLYYVFDAVCCWIKLIFALKLCSDHHNMQSLPLFSVPPTCLYILTVMHLMIYRRSKAKPEPMEPEADPERDQRTVFAYQVAVLLIFDPLCSTVM